MQFLQSFATIAALVSIPVNALYTNSTTSQGEWDYNPTTLAPSYTVEPITTTITYEDPTTTFYITQTMYTTKYLPLSISSATSTPMSTVTSEYLSVYSDLSTTYTSTLTSTLVVYATVTLANPASITNFVATSVPAITTESLVSDDITTTLTKTLKITTKGNSDKYIPVTTASVDATATDAAVEQNLENKQVDNTFDFTTTAQQCQDVTQYVTVTATTDANQVTQYVTVTPEIKYITVTAPASYTSNYGNSTTPSNSTLSM